MAASAGKRKADRARKSKAINGEPTHWKTAGFDAFDPDAKANSRRRKRSSRVSISSKRRKPKMVKCKKLSEPETGIHSLVWAQAIASQSSSSGFLKLPLEVRNKIYEYVICNFTIGPEYDAPIMPRKKGNKFEDLYWRTASNDTTAVYQLCRQVYVDVVGSGLLYKYRRFYFSSPKTMLNYLWVINPVLKDSIQNIHLDISCDMYTSCFREKGPGGACGRPFEFLADCKNLQHLTVNIVIDVGLYSINRHVLEHRRGVYTIREEVLLTINASTALRAIRGLKSFELTFDLIHHRLRLREDSLDKCARIEAGIREEVTKAREVASQQ